MLSPISIDIVKIPQDSLCGRILRAAIIAELEEISIFTSRGCDDQGEESENRIDGCGKKG
ncbi:MAG: hypothetical protein ACLPN1_12745 [Dissulfurispiraceae bacterium]|jgi:hypothetical protein